MSDKETNSTPWMARGGAHFSISEFVCELLLCVCVQVTEMCQHVKEQMFEYYEQHSQGMEASITELSEVLERSSQLSMELQGASQTLAAINKGLQHSTEQ